MWSRFGIRGLWLDDRYGGASAVVTDFRAGLLVTKSLRGEVVGQPDAFVAQDGSSGSEVVRRLLEAPSVENLRCGALREAIASVRWVARVGFSETRAWDGDDYIVTPGDGACAVVRFRGEGCVAVLVSLDPSREIRVEDILASASPAVQELAKEVLALPLLSADTMSPVTALFWGDAGRIVSGEAWPATYTYGAEILRCELLDDEAWLSLMATYENVTPRYMEAVVALAHMRYATNGCIEIEPDWFEELVPPDGRFKQDAMGLLAELGFTRPARTDR